MKIEHSYGDLTGGKWLRGNLHAHTTNSDGKMAPQAVIDDYAGRGYDFLMISDHDIYTGPEQYAKWQSRGMTLIPGNEVSANGPHLLHVDADRRVEPHGSRQQVIDDVAHAGGFVVMNHPNWQKEFDHITFKDLYALQGFVGIEIFNGVIHYLEGTAYASDKWDKMLSRSRRVWGFANDDSHSDIGIGLGWNVVYSPTRKAADIVNSMKQGRFYASTGVEITNIAVKNNTIRIDTSNADRIVAYKQHGARFKWVDDNSIQVEVPAGTDYVRFECWGRGESFAWTQPFYISQ